MNVRRWLATAAVLVTLLSLGRAQDVALARCELALRVETDSRSVRGTATLEIEARGTACASARFSLNELLKLSAVKRDGKEARFVLGDRIAEGRAIIVTLDPPLAAGARCELAFDYAGVGQDPDEQGPDWMGILLVREGEIRMSHQAQWHPVVPCDANARSKWPAPAKLELDLPPGFESLGPGALSGVKKHKGREIHTWVSERPVMPSILAGKYKVQSIKRDKITVRVLSTAEHSAGATLWADDAAQSLETLSQLFGKLGASQYGMAEMHIRNRSKSYNYEADGFSVYAGVLFDGRAPDAKKIAHEVAHMWFGGAVDATGAGERFLTEGLAEFAAWCAVEARSGAEAARDAAQKGLERYASSPGAEHALAETDFSSPRFSQVAYSKGAFAMRTLRAWMGAKPLNEALRDYIAAHKLARARRRSTTCSRRCARRTRRSRRRGNRTGCGAPGRRSTP